MEIKTDEIVVENRVRRVNGWLDSLERSIEQCGVLQPIGITRDKKLIFGGRRLQACKNIGMKTIPVRIFDIDADDPVTALEMEREENEHRRDLTPSEKTEIAMRIEEAMSGRVGNPNLKPIRQNFAQFQTDESVNVQQSPKGRSADIAAKSVGMNRETYRQAKAVVQSGNNDVIQAMDTGEKSINAAYNSIKKTETPQTFKITLKNSPDVDAELLLEKGGPEYCTKLALAILKAAGHNIAVD